LLSEGKKGKKKNLNPSYKTEEEKAATFLILTETGKKRGGSPINSNLLRKEEERKNAKWRYSIQKSGGGETHYPVKKKERSR